MTEPSFMMGMVFTPDCWVMESIVGRLRVEWAIVLTKGICPLNDVIGMSLG